MVGNFLQSANKAADAPTFENSLPSLTGEDKRLFVDFAMRMLRWMPEERATAGELLEHPWLKTKQKGEQ